MHADAAAILRSILGLLLGLLVAFGGYRLSRRFAGIAGFVIGFAVGLVLGIPGGPLVSLFAALVVGILFAVLFLFAFRIAGGALGGAAGWALADVIGWPTWAGALLLVVGAVAGLILNRLMIIAATAALGAWLATRSSLELLHDAGMVLSMDRAVYAMLGGYAVAIVGFLLQWRATRGEG